MDTAERDRESLKQAERSVLQQIADYNSVDRGVINEFLSDLHRLIQRTVVPQLQHFHGMPRMGTDVAFVTLITH